jgi:hypothetical protein
MQHPSLFLAHKYTDLLRHYAGEAEQNKQLHPQQLELIHQQGWLNMFVPKNKGGLALSLPEVLKMEEALAWTDGSVAWVVTLCAGAAWFVGFMDPMVATELFSNPETCFAGSGMTSGVAEQVPGGYKLNGQWKYASGALHATVFTANFCIHQNGQPLLRENGMPVIRPFVMKREEVTLRKTWHSMGMVATGTHAFEVKELTVPAQRSFLIDANAAVINDPVYQYPFLQLAETTLAINLSGMAIRFIDLCEELFVCKNKGDASVQKKKMNDCRDAFYEAVERSWKQGVDGEWKDDSTLQGVSEVSHHLARCAREVVDALYPFCGLTAADTREEINRVWRNLHTASQHSLFAK